MYDLIIIGGGPAGLAAAAYAIGKQLNLLVVSQDIGGKTNDHMDLLDGDKYFAIPGMEIVRRFQNELNYLNFARSLESVTSISKSDNVFTVTAEGNTAWKARTVIFATGARPRKLGVPGEEEFAGFGLSYSAISHTPLLADRRATVIGASRLALRATAELVRVAASINLVVPSPGLLGTPLAQTLTKNKKVIVWDSYRVKAIEGTGYVEQVVLQSPSGSEKVIETEGVFVELGLVPNSELVKSLVERDEEGRIRVDSVNRTSCPGLFAAGDVTNVYAEQVLIAIGEGTKAALSVYDYTLIHS